jgi:hypothetical protein
MNRQYERDMLGALLLQVVLSEEDSLDEAYYYAWLKYFVYRAFNTWSWLRLQPIAVPQPENT